MNDVQYSHNAMIDLIEIEKYISEELASPTAAKNTLIKITKKVRLLKNFAELGAPLSSIVDIESDYRFLVSGNYLIFYRVAGTDVLVIRVIYGGRDYLSILFEGYESIDETVSSDRDGSLSC